MAKYSKVALAVKSNNIDTISLDGETDVIKNRNTLIGMSPTTDHSSREDIPETYQLSTNQSMISLDTSESATELDIVQSPEVDITYKTNKADTISLDDEKDFIKTENIQFELLSTTDDSSREDIPRTYKDIPRTYKDIPKTYKTLTNRRNKTKNVSFISLGDKKDDVKNKNIHLSSTDDSSIEGILNTYKPLMKQRNKTNEADTISSDDENDFIKSPDILGLSSTTDVSSKVDILKAYKPLMKQRYKSNSVASISLDDDEKDGIKTENIQFGLLSPTVTSSGEDMPKIYTSSKNERDKTNSPDTISLDEEKNVRKIKNIHSWLSSPTDESSQEDILKTNDSETNESVNSSDSDEMASDLDSIHIQSPDVKPVRDIEKCETKIYKAKSPKYTCPLSANIDEKDSYLNMKRFPYASSTYGSPRKGSLPVPPFLFGGDYPFFKNKSAASFERDGKGNDEKDDDQKEATKVQIDNDFSSDLFPLDNEVRIKEAASIISMESSMTASTLRDAFQIPSLKNQPAGRINDTGVIRTHWRTTGLYRNCPQTFITKHARLEKRNWSNTAFVVTGLYVFGFFCLGYAVSSSAVVNPVIIILGVLLVSLATVILYLIYAIEKNRSLYTLSSGERRKVTFSNPFPAIL